MKVGQQQFSIAVLRTACLVRHTGGWAKRLSNMEWKEGANEKDGLRRLIDKFTYLQTWLSLASMGCARCLESRLSEDWELNYY